jgi:hypothetical protein
MPGPFEGGGPMPDNPQHPGNADVGPPPGVGGRPDTPTEWKRYDQASRLEEKRDQMSRQRDAEIQDTMRRVMDTQKDLAAKFHQHESFIREFRSACFSRNGNGKLIAAPQGRGHRRVRVR